LDSPQPQDSRFVDSVATILPPKRALSRSRREAFPLLPRVNLSKGKEGPGRVAMTSPSQARTAESLDSRRTYVNHGRDTHAELKQGGAWHTWAKQSRAGTLAQ